MKSHGYKVLGTRPLKEATMYEEGECVTLDQAKLYCTKGGNTLSKVGWLFVPVRETGEKYWMCGFAKFKVI